MAREQILIVDDEPKILRLVRSNLEKLGYKIITAQDGESALSAAEMNEPDLIILDLMLPRMDGYEVCRRLREFSTVPVIMLTAREEEPHKIRGLELGADDYLTKPFSVQELIARIRAVLRRTRLPNATRHEPAFKCEGFEMNFAQRRLFAAGRQVKLSPTEYKLLYHLVTNHGRVVLHQDLLTKVWGREYRDETEYLRVYIRYLRQKIEVEPSSPRLILTEPGVGYMFAGVPEKAQQQPEKAVV